MEQNVRNLDKLGFGGEPKIAHVQGIHFQPHKESESVSLMFDQDGNLCNIISLTIGIGVKSKFHWQFTKTQFAGPETHIQLIHLLSYLRKKYFKKMIIRDEGGYHPKKDKDTLAARMGFISNAINTVSDIFDNSEFTGKTPDEIMQQMQEALNRSFKDITIHIIKVEAKNLPDDLRRQLEEDFDNE